MSLFIDRTDAGKKLALLAKQSPHSYDLVLGLARGGVPVAYEIAHSLNLPLDVFIVRKLGVPGHEELAMGAIASDGVCIFNEEIIKNLEPSQKAIQAVIEKETQELERRNLLYRGGKAPLTLKGKHLILVDDGIATGASIKAAIQALKALNPASISLAVPVAESSTLAKLRPLVKDILCLHQPQDFYGVGQWYQNFSQVSDNEVCALLAQTQENTL